MDLLDQVHLKLATHHSKLVAQSVSLTYGGFSIATNLMASEDKLHFIREGVWSTFPGALSTSMELPSSMLYLKLVNVPITAHDRLITPEIVLQQIAKAGPSVRDFGVLQTPPPLGHQGFTEVRHGYGLFEHLWLCQQCQG
jgi:hypothetical protein